MLQLPETSRSAKRSTKRIANDPLGVISDSIQPLSRCPEPSLKAELDRLEADNNIGGMVALYDYFVSLTEAGTYIGNMPRAEPVDDFVSKDSARHCARAYAVADRLKRMKPREGFDRLTWAHTLMNAAFLMGGTLQDAAKLMRHFTETERL